jgi:hypothetical protein
LGGRKATSQRKFIGRTRTPFSLIKEVCFIKNKKLSIRITESDLQKIHHKANKAHMSFTDYVTKVCLGKQIFVINGLDEVIRQQKAIGRNLNQLTTLCNMGKVNVIYLSELTNQYAQVSKLLTSLLDRKRWSV